MDELITAASNHPLVAILIVSTAVVVALYLVKRHFWRIFLVAALTFLGYYLYSNGYFTKEKIQNLKSVDLNQIEKSAQSGMDKGVAEIKSITGQQVEKNADRVRDDVKDQMMNEIKKTPDNAADAAAARAARKDLAPAAGDNDAARNRSRSKTAH